MATELDAEEKSRIHRRQFVFSNVRIDPPIGWNCTGLGGGFFLYHSPWLNIATVADASGQQWVLLGHAFEVGESLLGPIGSIRRSQTGDVPALVATWAGRWLLLCSSAVITDAAALLGVYILENEKGVFVSSSLAILSQLTATSVRDYRTFGWYGFNWFPGPLSKLHGVRRLLPDQIYNPESRSIKFFNRLSVLSDMNVKDAANEMSLGLSRVFHAMSSQGSHHSLILTLTGGLDSRTTFSVLQASGVPFRTLTLEHPRITKADVTLPAAISAARRIVHRYVPSGKLLHEKLDEYDLHTYGCVVDGDRELYASGVYENLGPRNWLIRSGCWELGRKYFHQRLRGLSLEELLDRPDRVMGRFNTYFGVKPSAESLREWAQWRLEHAIAIPWQELFYRDQRLGCWSSSIEHSLDLLDPVSIHPVNCDYFYGLMLGSAESHDSKANPLQQQIIATCAPDLIAVPINPPDGLYAAARNMVLKIAAIAGGEARNLLRSIK